MRFMRVNEKTGQTLRDFWRVVEPRLPQLLDNFYAHLLTVPQLSGLVGTQAPRLKAAQASHWQRLFAGTFDDSYMQGVRTIGLTHNRIGLEPRWYIGGYLLVMNKLAEIAIENYRRSPQQCKEAVAATNTAIMMDMELALAVYQEAYAAAAEKVKRESMNKLADEFDATVKGVVQAVSDAANGVQEQSQALSASAEQTSRQVTAVAAASEQASSNVQTVASASEEMAASVTEISRRMSETQKAAHGAADEAAKTNVKMTGLSDAAEKIGNVVKLISDIASQTNLLALNATIEAARAGDAGKGFAVVAAEVKNLATQTANATEEIAKVVNSMQAATTEMVAAIQAIGKQISGISEISAAVAGAVEEQRAATQEIARNVQEAAKGAQEVSANISGVSQTASATGSAATTLLQASREIGKQSDVLRQQVQTFLDRARAA